MEDKIARICWNDNWWKSPSGSKGKSRSAGSYETNKGYGHEEWLFDKSCTVNGYHYAFLEPIYKAYKSGKHVGKTYNITLFTLEDGTKYFVGEIKNAKCISKEESKATYQIYKKNGWLKKMAEELKEVGVDPQSLNETSPEEFFNVKFKFEDVGRPDELVAISGKDKNIPIPRYQLLPKSGKIEYEAVAEDGGKLKSTTRRNRTYDGDSSFDPYHDKMQNALFQLLRANYGKEYKKDTICIEKDRVDIKAKTHSGEWHYFEIKTESPKLSIRHALGQVMEYSYWPDSERAEKLIVVSDEPPNSETKKYLAHIRKKFKIPIFYRSLDMEKKALSVDF